jgi:hypothetical protein
VVVKLSWSIASLTRGFSGLSGNAPHSDHPVTDKPDQTDQDEKRSVLVLVQFEHKMIS